MGIIQHNGRPELHALRQEWAIRLAEMHERQLARDEAEHLELSGQFDAVLAGLGIPEDEWPDEWVAVIMDATPTAH